MTRRVGAKQLERECGGTTFPKRVWLTVDGVCDQQPKRSEATMGV